MSTILRGYRAADAESTHAVFLAAVRGTASAHYTPEQIKGWTAWPPEPAGSRAPSSNGWGSWSIAR